MDPGDGPGTDPMTYTNPTDLILAVRQSRGSDPGPPNTVYLENRSLEAPDGSVAPPEPDWAQIQHDLEAGGRAVQLARNGPPPQAVLPDPTPPPMPVIPVGPERDFVQLDRLWGRLGEYPVKITEAEAQKIRQVLIKAIRRDLRSMSPRRRKKA